MTHVVGAILLLLAASVPVPAAPDLTGIWRSAGSDTPALAGTVTVERRREGWFATVGGVDADSSTDTVSFAQHQGELRLALSGHELDGMWIQPGSPIDSNAYATPLRFRAGGNDRWSASLRPYTPRYELFVTFTRRADGSLAGFIRDPIGNFGTMAPFDSVTVAGTALSIVTRAHHYTGSLTDDPNTISIHIGTGSPMTFHRVDGTGALGFLPRTGFDDSAPEKPVENGDGWSTASLIDAGIDPAPIVSIVHTLASEAPASPRAPYLQGLLVARNGRLVLDEYFYGFDAATPHDVRSAGKSLDAALFGIALTMNPRLDVTAPVMQWLPYTTYENADPRKSRMTIANLFDMTSGLACDDNDDNSPGNEDTMQSQTAQSDWYKYMMDLPMQREPGAEPAVYCSGGLNILGGIIARATHAWTPQLFDERFARPLQFGEYHLQLTPGNEMYLGGGSYFLPRDFIKLGQLFLQQGRWMGRRLFSTDWAAQAVRPQSGLTAPGDYGYAWHLTTYAANGTTFPAYEAQGNGGQYLIVVPKLQLVIGILSANYGDYFTWRTFHDLIAQPIVAACR